MNGKSRISLFIPIILLILLVPVISNQTVISHASAKSEISRKLFQPSSLNDSIELGYGPDSLFPIDEQIPVYTTNDWLYAAENYNTSVSMNLYGEQGQLLNAENFVSGEIARIFSFVPGFPTSNLTLSVCAPVFPPSCDTIPIMFVNPSQKTGSLSNVTAAYSMSGSVLTSTFGAPDLTDKLNVQQCLTNESSADEAVVPIPSSFGTGSIEIIGNPALDTAELFLGSVFPSGVFAFSFELFANYTFVLPQNNGSSNGYTGSEVEVASSNSVLINSSSLSSINVSLTQLASFQAGRYALVAQFVNGNTRQQLSTEMLLESPLSSSWFWLGACNNLGSVTPPTFADQDNLSAPPNEWPRYLFLMYEVLPGIESFTNLTLSLDISMVKIVIGANGLPLPSDIHASWMPGNPGIKSANVAGGDVYFVTDGSYPVEGELALSFGGKTFDTLNVTLSSPYAQATEGISLGEFVISSQQGSSAINANVTVHSNTLNTSIILVTGSHGKTDIFVPPGSYNIIITEGSQMRTETVSIAAGQAVPYTANFPGPINYTLDIVWVVVIITVLAAFGNLWYWFLERQVRKFLAKRQPRLSD